MDRAGDGVVAATVEIARTLTADGDSPPPDAIIDPERLAAFVEEMRRAAA